MLDTEQIKIDYECAEEYCNDRRYIRDDRRYIRDDLKRCIASINAYCDDSEVKDQILEELYTQLEWAEKNLQQAIYKLNKADEKLKLIENAQF